MNFIFHENSKLPKLAWCSFIVRDKNMHAIMEGETRDRFFVEGAWNGDLKR